MQEQLSRTNKVNRAYVQRVWNPRIIIAVISAKPTKPHNVFYDVVFAQVSCKQGHTDMGIQTHACPLHECSNYELSQTPYHS